MKKYSSTLLSIAFLIPAIVFAQSAELIWAQSYGSNSNDKITASTLGQSESIYSTGHYNNVVDFDPSDDLFELSDMGNVFIQKLNGLGELNWVKGLSQTSSSAGGWSITEGTGIATDLEDNVITVGNFDAEIDFDPGAEEYILDTNGYADVFIQKMNTDGEFLWAVNIGDSGYESATAVATDTDNNIYVIGVYSEIVDFDPDPDNEILLDANSMSGGIWASSATFILKLDPDGNTVWAHSIPNDNKGGYPQDIATDSENNVVITGYFTGNTEFGAGAEGSTVYGSHDCYLLKLDSEAEFLWLQVLSSSSFNIGYAIEIDGSDNIYHTGQYGGTIDFDFSEEEESLTSSGYNSTFVQKIEADGSLTWVKSLDGNGSHKGLDIAIDSHGDHDVYITGTFGGTADFDPSDGEYNLTCLNSDFEWGENIYLEKLSPDGNFLWAEVIEYSSLGQATTILPYSDGGVLITGLFYGTPDFDPSDNEFILDTGGGGSDAFIAKYLFCLSESFGLYENVLSDLLMECEITALPVPEAKNGCGIHFPGTPDISFPITEEGNYTVTWTYENSDGQILTQDQNFSLQYTNTAVEHIGDHLSAQAEGYTYQWVDCDDDDMPIAGATEQNFYPTSGGNYAVEITNADGCTHSSACINFFGIGLTENQFDTEIEIYPNPTSGIININFNKPYEQINIRIIDILGNEIQQTQLQFSNSATFEINAANGWYFVEMENELGEIARTKILKN